MDLNYISGFFDADGSITMSYQSKDDKFRCIKIDFTNTDKNLLLEIQQYLLLNYNLKLSISTKPAKKTSHSIGYSLSASSNQVCYKLCELLNSHHSKKLHRINTILKYHNIVTKKNGKYSIIEYDRKLAYERLFFCTSFH
jgi:hypothetical protein